MQDRVKSVIVKFSYRRELMNKIKVMTVFGTRPEAIKMAPLVLKLKQDERFEEVTVVSAQHREMLDMNKIKVMTVFGTRPEAIKMAPLVLKLKQDERFEEVTVVSAQHREMLDLNKIKVMTVFGTRPEAIKMAPLVLKLKQDERFEEVTVVSAQHREMLDQVLDIFKIKPDYDFNIMHKNQTLEEITSKVMIDLAKVIKKEKPDIVLVHGDTTTSFAAGLATFYEQTTLGHVEAGLRTWNKYSPFPEEMNRQMTDDLADLYFAPTEVSKANLLKENHPADNIFVTGIWLK